MNSSVTIRRAAIADAPALTALGVTAFVQAFGPANKKEDMDKYVAEEMNEDKIAAELAINDNRFYLAYVAQSLAGYVKLRTSTTPDELAGYRAIEIERLYVLREFQNNKIGSALMQHSIDHAIAGGFDMLWLGVWEHNPNAIRFYRSWGFELFGSHPFVVGHDVQTDVLMKKVLS